jgi:hypothetical protein
MQPILGRSLITGFVLLSLACGSGADPESTRAVTGAGLEASRAFEDSLTALVEGYKAGRLTRAMAATRVANLLEPQTGVAAQTTDSMTLDLFDAAGVILRERFPARYGFPDSLR